MTSRVIIDTCIPYEWEHKPIPIEMDAALADRIRGQWASYFEEPATPAIPVAEPVAARA